MHVEHATDVPHLTTALTGPLQDLEKHIIQNQIKIETWIRKQWRETSPPLYSSVDLRNSGFKIAPVDTNLFPAGFNNLNRDFFPLCIQAFQSSIDLYYPGCQRILLIPENHTRNLFYLDNIATLQEILTKAGFDVRIGSLIKEMATPLTIDLPSKRKITLEPLVHTGNRLGVSNFSACLILLNNDLSEGIPDILKGLEQPINPPPELGWHYRRKSTHFSHYENVVKEFSNLIGIDPWLINPIFSNCGKVNFLKREGEECLMHNIDVVLNGIKQKYAEYGIQQKPFVVVKAEAGTYGMGVIMIHDAKEILSLNRKERTRMSTSKGQKEITQVIIQEGVYTFETWGEHQTVAEPVVYMIGQHVIGGFYRVHINRGISDNLNTPGAQFESLAFVDCCNNPSKDLDPENYTNRFYTYGVIARLALVAAAREKKEVCNT